MKKYFHRDFKRLLFLLLSFCGISGSTLFIYSFSYILSCLGQLSAELNKTHDLNSKLMGFTTEIYDVNKKKIGEITDERRYYVAFSDFPTHLIQAFISAEDKHFYHHHGISIEGMIRSLWINIKDRAFRQGASTITQQLARVSFLNANKSFERKIKEILLAIAIEQRLTKNEILELYLNKIYLGNHSYGIESASRNYFRKRAKDLTIAEAAILASLPKAPSRYAPHKHPELTFIRQNAVLNRMQEDGYLSSTEKNFWAAKNVDIAPRAESYDDLAPYFIAFVKREVEEKLGITDLAKFGLKIYTSLDLSLQKIAEKSLNEMTREKVLNPNSDHFEGAFLALDSRSGAIRAMQGGRSFKGSQFNRVFWCKRPLGLIFAPIFLSYAFDQGYTLTSIAGKDLFSGGLAQPNILNNSIYESFLTENKNELAKVFFDLGGGNVQAFANLLGFSFEKNDLSLALGEGPASVAEVGTGFVPIINGGYAVEPYAIEKVETTTGTILYQHPKGAQRRVISESSAFISKFLLQEKMQKELLDLHLPVKELTNFHGITEINDDLKNAWFAGGTENLTAIMWIGSEFGKKPLTQSKNAFKASFLTQISKTLSNLAKHHKSGFLLPPSDISFAPLPSSIREQRKRPLIALPFVTGREPRFTNSEKSF